MEAAAPLPGLEAEVLAPVVAQVLGRPGGQVAGWTVQRIQGGAGEALGVYRVFGQLEHGGAALSWSVILKVLGRPEHGGGPDDWNYWRREAMVYQSGLAAQLPRGLSLPRCFGVLEQPGDRLWLWLEDVSERPDAWTLSNFGQVAFRIGQFNAQYLNGRPLPGEAWVSRGWLRGWVEENAPTMAQFPGLLSHPMLQRCYPPDIANGLLDLWAERHWYLQILEQLPQTLCHMDVFRRNALARAAPYEDYVLLDWAFTGQGAIGEELVALVLGSLSLFEAELGSARELEETVLAGYAGGLRAEGWQGDPRLARLGFAAAGALRYTVGTVRFSTWLTDERSYPRVEEIFHRPVGALCDAFAELDRQVTQPLVASVRGLAAELGL